MDSNKLYQANELSKKIETAVSSLVIIKKSLEPSDEGYNRGELKKRFTFSKRELTDDKVSLSADSVKWFNAVVIDREAMELLRDHYIKKLDNLNAEFEAL